MRQLICFSCSLPSMVSLCFIMGVFLISINPSVNGSIDSSNSPNWDTIFSSRNDDEWKQLWHTEKHRRCYQDLLIHMDWVCDKDIYKLRKKRDLIEVEPLTNGPFLSSKKANMFGILRLKKANRRQYKRGIIDECCNGVAGCSWEEYAEYCPANKRIRTK